MLDPSPTIVKCQTWSLIVLILLTAALYTHPRSTARRPLARQLDAIFERLAGSLQPRQARGAERSTGRALYREGSQSDPERPQATLQVSFRTALARRQALVVTALECRSREMALYLLQAYNRTAGPVRVYHAFVLQLTQANRTIIVATCICR